MSLLKTLLSLLLFGAVGYLSALVGMYAFQRRLLYHPSRTPFDVPQGVAEVWLTAQDGVRLNAWFVSPKDDAPVVLFLHGNAGNLETVAEKLAAYRDAGFGLLALDWRGYGKSQGRPSESGLYEDAKAAMLFLESQGVANNRVFLHGESLGSGVATWIAEGHRVAGVVLEAPFTSIADAAQFHYPYLPAKWLAKDRFDSLARIAVVKAPILIMQCEEDRTVPVSHGRALLAAAGANAKGVVYPGGGHMDCFDLGGREAAISFIREIAS